MQSKNSARIKPIPKATNTNNKTNQQTSNNKLIELNLTQTQKRIKTQIQNLNSKQSQYHKTTPQSIKTQHKSSKTNTIKLVTKTSSIAQVNQHKTRNPKPTNNNVTP